MLIVPGGLPGTGKTTIESEILALLPVILLRVDIIEQSLRSACVKRRTPSLLGCGTTRLQSR